MIAEDIIAGKLIYQSHTVEIASETGKVLHTVRFGNMVRLVP